MTATSRALQRIKENTGLLPEAVENALHQFGIDTTQPTFPTTIGAATKLIKQGQAQRTIAREEMTAAIEHMDHVQRLEEELAAAMMERDKAVWLALHSGVTVKEMAENSPLSYGWVRNLKARPAPGVSPLAR